MAYSSVDVLRWTLLGALGASFTTSCGGVAEDARQNDSATNEGTLTTATRQERSSEPRNTPSQHGDGDGGDGDLSMGDGDGDILIGDGDGDILVGDGDGDLGCTNPVELGGGFYSCEEGYLGRSEPASCPVPPPRDDLIGDSAVCGIDEGCCLTDADCSGPLQFCQPSSWEPGAAICTTGCFEDADCPGSQICQCGDRVGQCVQASCTEDADCPGDARCANSAPDPFPEYPIGSRFACQSPEDECVGSVDCEGEDVCSSWGDARSCGSPWNFCGGGRPFLVGAEIRQAPLCGRLDWVEKQTPDLRGLSEKERHQLAKNWETLGQMEHASIAAFARFSMQLLSMGAPADLIERTNEALVEETRHARLCFGLASAYRGEPVGPGPLEMVGVMNEFSREAIVVMAIVEGCVGETVAALEASEAASRCVDETVKSVLLRIAEEESRHAELAWRFVDWALEQWPELQPSARGVFDDLLREKVGDRKVSSEGPLAKYGVLSSECRESIRRLALREVVKPCAQRLHRIQHAAQQSNLELRA